MKKLERYIVYPILLFLFILFVFLDFPLSDTLYDPNNFFGCAGELFAETPIFLMLVFASGLMFRFRPKDTKTKSVLFGILFGICLAGFSFYAGQSLRGYINDVFLIHISFLWSFALAIPYFAIGFGLSFLIKKDDPWTCFWVGLSIIILFAISTIVAYIFKYFWLRPRYRTLAAFYEEGLIESIFSGWKAVYQPQGFWSYSSYADLIAACSKSFSMDDFFSFPSGHTMEATCMVCLSFIPLLLSDESKKKGNMGFYLRLIGYAWGILIAISRILRGAHTGTDVTIGFAISVASYDLVSSLILPKLLAIHKKEAAPVSEVAN